MKKEAKKFVLDVCWSFLSLGVSSGVHFFLRIFLARYLGPSDLGLYSLAFVFFSLGIMLSGFGIGTAITKYVAEHRDSKSDVNLATSTGIQISAAIGTTMGIILYCSSSVISNDFFSIPELVPLLKIVAVSFPFLAVEKAVIGSLNGLRHMRLYMLINVSQNSLIIIFSIVAVLLGHGVYGAAIGLVVPVIICGILSLMCVRGSFLKLHRAQFKPMFVTLVNFGFFVILANGLSSIQYYANNVMLGFFKTDAEVGIYGIAAILSQIIILPSQALQTITAPSIASHWGKGENTAIENLVNICAKYSVLIAIPIGFLMALLSSELIAFIYGSAYISADLPLRILVIGSICNAPVVAAGTVLSCTEHINKVFAIGGISLVVNVIVNLFLIPFLGIIGCSITSTITMIFTVFVYLLFIKKFAGISIDIKWFLKVILLTILLGTTAYFCGMLFNRYICVFLALILLILILIKYFLSKNERRQLLGLIPWL